MIQEGKKPSADRQKEAGGAQIWGRKQLRESTEKEVLNPPKETISPPPKRGGEFVTEETKVT